MGRRYRLQISNDQFAPRLYFSLKRKKQSSPRRFTGVKLFPDSNDLISRALHFPFQRTAQISLSRKMYTLYICHNALLLAMLTFLNTRFKSLFILVSIHVQCTMYIVHCTLYIVHGMN